MTAPVNVHERLVWSRGKLHRMRMTVFVLGTAAAITGAFIVEKDLQRFALGVAAAVFLGFAVYDLFRTLENAALIELLPAGIIFRTTNEDFIVPWNEIHGVNTIDVHAEFRGREEIYPGVTVVLVSKLFYDRVIHEGWMIMRGPGWDAHFIPEGDKMQLALHHEILPATAAEVRRQVEERWKFFKSQA
ncbi:MAG: hypothetical protein KF794_08375 [Xanthobacteraceae bacterium]|nr:hypothetical protein [Xanthobacteraceae bacterium]QYK43826.1 MAG: hypothetical protein KF794_08375 [Xanthobacteraceae bacterium]